MRREVNTVDELRAIVGAARPVRRQQGEGPAVADPARLAGAFAAGFRRDDGRSTAASTCRRRATRRASSTSSTTPRSRFRSGRATSGWTATSTCCSGRMSARCSSFPAAGTRCASTEPPGSSPTPTTSTRWSVQGQAADPRAGDRRRRGVLPLRQGISAVRRLGPVDVESDRRAQRRADRQGDPVRLDASRARGVLQRGQHAQGALLRPASDRVCAPTRRISVYKQRSLAGV